MRAESLSSHLCCVLSSRCWASGSASQENLFSLMNVRWLIQVVGVFYVESDACFPHQFLRISPGPREIQEVETWVSSPSQIGIRRASKRIVGVWCVKILRSVRTHGLGVPRRPLPSLRSPRQQPGQLPTPAWPTTTPPFESLGHATPRHHRDPTATLTKRPLDCLQAYSKLEIKLNQNLNAPNHSNHAGVSPSMSTPLPLQKTVVTSGRLEKSALYEGSLDADVSLPFPSRFLSRP